MSIIFLHFFCAPSKDPKMVQDFTGAGNELKNLDSYFCEAFGTSDITKLTASLERTDQQIS